MKKFMMTLAAGLTLFAAQAQKQNVQSAIIYLRNAEMEDAKKSIDEAAVHEDTRNDLTMWVTRAAIYDTILHNEAYKALVDSNAIDQFVMAIRGCINTDVKKRYEDYCPRYGLINASFKAYLKAYDHLQAKRFEPAIRYFEYVIGNIPLDVDNTLERSNISETKIYDDLYRWTYAEGRYDLAKKYSQKLIDVDYQQPLIYYYNASSYLAEGDTAKAIEVISAGRKRFATEKDLLNFELNIYLAQNRSDIILAKIDEALAADTENDMLLYVRGNIYDRQAGQKGNAAAAARKEADVLKGKAKKETVPANKNKLENQAKKQIALADSLTTEMVKLAHKAEADYLKAIEINPEKLDYLYSIGALLNNHENSEIVAKMNAISANTQAEYDKKMEPLRKRQNELLSRALKYFNDALAVVESMSEANDQKKREKLDSKLMVLESIKLVYRNLNNVEKFNEYNKLINDLSNQ